MTKRFFAAHKFRSLTLGALVATLALVGIVPCATAQFGDDTADRRALELYEEGEAAYTEGRYEAAVRSFTAAHRLTPRPLLLYNLANAYERLGRYPEAVQALEQYLPDAPIDERAVLQTRLENLRIRVAGETPTQTVQEPPPDAVVATPEPSPAESDGGGADLFVPGIGLTAGGLAMLGAGVAFGVLALDARDAVSGTGAGCASTADGRTLCLAGAEGSFADAELYGLLADIGMFGGGAITAVGLALLVVGATSDAPSDSVSWAPELNIGPTGVSLGARGRF